MLASRSHSGVASSTQGVLALILASDRGHALAGLTARQAKAAIPFGGQHRLIDFALSNCVNSEIRQIALLTQYKSQSLIRHVHRGWGFLHPELGEYVEIWPAQQQTGERWYRGAVDAVSQNLELIEASRARHVLLVAGDEIHTLDYSLLLDEHVASDADVTVACTWSGGADRSVVATQAGRIERVEDLAAHDSDQPCLAPMGAFLFATEVLIEWLRQEQSASRSADLATDLLPSLASRARVHAYVADDPTHWRVLDTVDRYWHAHMELLEEPSLDVFGDDSWPVFTRYRPLPPARVLRSATVDGALLSPGSVVAGEVSRSIVSAHCRIGAGSLVNDSVLLPGATIGAGCVLDRVVVDADCAIPDGTRLGSVFMTNSSHYSSPGGIVLATSSSAVPMSSPGCNVRKIA